MNLTVGPLPSAVYWRRRAIVIAGLIATILLIVYSCGGSGTSDSNGARKTAVTVSDRPSSPSASADPGATGAPSLSPSLSPSDEPSDAPSGTPTVGANGVPVCADQDMLVSATIESTSASVSRLQLGGTFALKLKIQNVSDHACSRDVGTDPEELRVMHGSTKIWSSDDCDAATGAKKHDVRTFQPNIMIQANLTWNSYLNTAKSCTKGRSATPVGTYQLVGRLGSATSKVTEFKIQN
jgi:hypothetical protein